MKPNKPKDRLVFFVSPPTQQTLFEEIADLSFEHEISDLDAPYRAKRDLDTIYGDNPGYQYLADWITE